MLPFWAVLHVGFGVGISNLFIWARRKLSAKYDTLPLGGQDEGGEVGGSIVLSPLGSGDDGSGGAGGSGSGSNSNSNPPSRQLLFSMDDAIIIVCVSFPNSGNLPMALGQSVCSVSFDDVFGDADADTCSALVVGYVALYLIIYQPLLWGSPRFLEAGVATAANTPRKWQQQQQQRRRQRWRMQKPKRPFEGRWWGRRITGCSCCCCCCSLRRRTSPPSPSP